MNTESTANVLAPLEPLLRDPDVGTIMVDGYDQVYVERHGDFEDVPSPFRDNEHVMHVINAIVTPLGCTVDAARPMVDARLSDGSRVNAVIPPVSLSGPILTLRKFKRHLITREQLIEFGACGEDVLNFLEACVRSRLDILVAGGISAGKTSFLNILANMIPDDERIITIENAAALQLTQKRVISLESRPASKVLSQERGGMGEKRPEAETAALHMAAQTGGEITIQDLVIQALRMRPDRLIVGELRSVEALELLQAMSQGHEGCLTTMHANSSRDALERLEMTATYHPLSIPLLTIRALIAKSINIIVNGQRLSDGSRKILKVSEVAGMESNAIVLNDIFEFRQTGQDAKGRIMGTFSATGKIPKCVTRIQAAGVDLPLSIFTPS